MPDPTTPAQEDHHANDTQARVLLAVLHDARERGDRPAALAAWEALLIGELRRVQAIVETFRDPALPGGRFTDADQALVVRRVIARLHEATDWLTGESVGEVRAFTRTAAALGCQDAARVGGALHGDGTPVAFSAVEGPLLESLVARLREADRAGTVRALVHEALVEVSPINRAVVVMDQAGVSVREMAERLEISGDGVLQRRRRGLLELRDAVIERMEDGELG